jgi:hypothetical protein
MNTSVQSGLNIAYVKMKNIILPFFKKEHSISLLEATGMGVGMCGGVENCGF